MAGRCAPDAYFDRAVFTVVLGARVRGATERLVKVSRPVRAATVGVTRRVCFSRPCPSVAHNERPANLIFAVKTKTAPLITVSVVRARPGSGNNGISWPCEWPAVRRHSRGARGWRGGAGRWGLRADRRRSLRRRLLLRAYVLVCAAEDVHADTKGPEGRDLCPADLCRDTAAHVCAGVCASASVCVCTCACYARRDIRTSWEKLLTDFLGSALCPRRMCTYVWSTK